MVRGNMATSHNERSFEENIEYILSTSGGYTIGNPANFDRENGLDPVVLLNFIKSSQPKPWDKIVGFYNGNADKEVIKNLTRQIHEQGLLEVLRYGWTDKGVKLKLAYFKPASGLNTETLALYEKNILTVTRQVHYSAKNSNSLDLVLSLNGIPIATAELKTPLTGQTVQDAISQYRHNRDPNESIFAFKERALVHFAVDPDEVHMTTKLDKKRTVFLPFNKGFENGKGNPPNPNGYKTSYLWEEVWAKDSWMEIINKFILIQKKQEKVDGKRVVKERVIFPRYHQLDAVRMMLATAKELGTGKDYLIEHSAGSGKSNTIAWLAHRLVSLHDNEDNAVYDSVVVVTDRKVLDRQLQDNIYQFEHQQGVVKCIDKNSKQLAEALVTGEKIVITTIEKFPVVIGMFSDPERFFEDNPKVTKDSIQKIKRQKYAVIIDEAHSSQSGKFAEAMHRALGLPTERDEEEGYSLEDAILESALAKGKQKNVSLFAFTATPKEKTLEKFGEKQSDGTFKAFHLYSMKQAIEENFILDVLKNYTTYEMLYKLEKKILGDPEVLKTKGIKALARWVTLHAVNISQKTELIIEHFRKCIMHQLSGKAKAMVVTTSREQAVKYKLAFDSYLQKKGYTDVRTLVAFSGAKTVDDISYTEAGMNGFSETELPEKFESDDYQVLLVAEKYQTGFDQPLLVAMYVDKKLAGLQAVQTLSRLNRTYDGKLETFVLDMVNDVDEIVDAFKPFYTSTELQHETDPNLLYTAQNKLREYRVYTQEEIDAFAAVFWKDAAKQTRQQNETDKGLMHAKLDPAVQRFMHIEEERQEEFRHVLLTFLRLYGFLSQIIDFQDIELEKLAAFGRFLAAKLPKRPSEKVNFNDEIMLDSYRLDKTFEGSLMLQADPAVVGIEHIGDGRKEEEQQAPLSELIHKLNDRCGGKLSEKDRLFFEQIATDMTTDQKIVEQAKANNDESQFRLGFDKKFVHAMVKREEQNKFISDTIMASDDILGIVCDYVAKEVLTQIREGVRQI